MPVGISINHNQKIKQMKKLVLLLTAIIILASCQEITPEPVTPQPDVNMENFNKNVETTKAFIDAFCANDSTSFASFVSDDFIWSPPSVGSDSLTKAEWENAMKSFMKAFTDKKLTNAQYFAGLDDDQSPNGDVRVYGEWNSKHAESGKDAKLKWYAVYFFNEQGKIVHQAEWYDTADLSKEF